MHCGTENISMASAKHKYARTPALSSFLLLPVGAGAVASPGVGSRWLALETGIKPTRKACNDAT